ncbi:MAG TPA: DUF2569 family protein [Stellaceae bacterium]|nr:DUF2569 family protein [Stellaceae bacterium]
MSSDTLPTSESTKPVGLTGWLALLAVGQIFGLLAYVVRLFQYYAGVPVQRGFLALPIAFIGEAILNIVFFLLISFSTYAILTKKRCFRWLYISEVMGMPLLILLDAAWISFTTALSFNNYLTHTDALQKAIAACIPGAVFTVYLFRSQRAKNTLIH